MKDSIKIKDVKDLFKRLLPPSFATNVDACYSLRDFSALVAAFESFALQATAKPTVRKIGLRILNHTSGPKLQAALTKLLNNAEVAETLIKSLSTENPRLLLCADELTAKIYERELKKAGANTETKIVDVPAAG